MHLGVPVIEGEAYSPKRQQPPQSLANPKQIQSKEELPELIVGESVASAHFLPSTTPHVIALRETRKIFII